MAGSLIFRVIFKATFESNLSPGGFLQKDFPPDFYLVLCNLSSASSRRTLRNCFQIPHSVSYRHIQVSSLPISICDLSFESMHSHSFLLLTKSLLMNSLLVFPTIYFQKVKYGYRWMWCYSWSRCQKPTAFPKYDILLLLLLLLLLWEQVPASWHRVLGTCELKQPGY